MAGVLEQLLMDSVCKNTPDNVKENNIFDYKNENEFIFKLTKKDVEDLNLWDWFRAYEKEAKVSTAGIRGPQNIVFPHDTRFPINTMGITLATLGKALVLKEKYPNKELVKLCACEVRYNSQTYLDIISRIQAGLGIVTLNPTNKQTIPIWLTSFLAFKLDLVGAEYITSSHGISVKNATKDLNDQGSQFLPDESMEFVNKMREILETVDKKGFYEIKFASLKDEKINQEAMKRLNNGIDLYVEYLKNGVGKKDNLIELKNFNKKILIDSVGGCAYKTTSKILEKLEIADKFSWLNVEEDPFFHSIGKYEKTDKNGEKYLYDWSLDLTVTAKDENGRSYFPVVNSMNYDTLIAKYPIGTVVLITDPDHDRLSIVQVDDIKNKGEIIKAGADFVQLNDNRILTIFSANQAFLMIMDFWMKQLKKNNIFDNHTRFIVKTTASSKSWDEWAKNNDVKVVNTPVGFKEIANVIKKIETQTNSNEIIIQDVFNNEISLGTSARLLFAGEESGGMIIGSEEMIKSKNGRVALAMREKSAAEAIVIASCLVANLGDTPLYKHLENIYSENKIFAKYDVRCDIAYYNESETNIEKLKKAKLEGEKLRSNNDIFYLALAIAVFEGKITLENAKEILSKTFPQFDFSNLLQIKFVGDGTYLDFEDKFIEIRPSGTDAKTKAYGGGTSKEELNLWTSVLGNYNGDMNEIYKKFIDKDYVLKVREKSFEIYEKYASKGANFKPFEVSNYDYLIK